MKVTYSLVVTFMWEFLLMLTSGAIKSDQLVVAFPLTWSFMISPQLFDTY